MISYDELFSSRSLTPNPRFLQLTHPDREILVRESYTIISVHYCIEAKRFQQSLVKLLRILQVGDFDSDMTNDCLSLLSETIASGHDSYDVFFSVKYFHVNESSRSYGHRKHGKMRQECRPQSNRVLKSFPSHRWWVNAHLPKKRIQFTSMMNLLLEYVDKDIFSCYFDSLAIIVLGRVRFLESFFWQ